MESGNNKCCLAVILYLLCHVQVSANGEISKISEALQNVCYAQNVQTREIDFPVENVPNEKQFVVFLQVDDQSDERFLTSDDKCIDGINSTSVEINACNKDRLSQKWFRYGNQIVNAENGKCLTTEHDCSQKLEICRNQSISENQVWSCSHNNTSISIHGSNNETTLTAASDGQGLCLSNQNSARWNFADISGEIIRLSSSAARYDVNRLCQKTLPYCGPPLQGVSSFILSTKDVLNSFRFPADLLYKITHSPYKTCFIGGDTILIGCAIGHTDISNNGKDYKEVTCLGGGVWSDPSPLNCKKKTCSDPESYLNTHYTGNSFLFGDMVNYHCDEGYVGESTIRICSPKSQWEGNFPKCKSGRESYLNSSSGTILSPNYPEPYPADVKYTWTIVVEPGLRIVLWFRDFFIQPGSLLAKHCQTDVFFIEDCLANNASTMYCGSTIPESWISTGHAVIIRLITDGHYEAKGFKIEYTSWNSSLSSEPMEPLHNGSYPDEEDDTHVFTGNEYAVYWVEAIYCTLAVTAIIFVISIVFSTLFSDIRARIHPATNIHPSDEDFIDEAERNRKLGQRRMTSVFDPATLRKSVLVPDELIDGWDAMSEYSSDGSYIELPGYAADNAQRHQKDSNISNLNSDSNALSTGAAIRPVSSAMKLQNDRDITLSVQAPIVNVINSSIENIPNMKTESKETSASNDSNPTTPEMQDSTPVKGKTGRASFSRKLPV